jgi:hypothetical protein
MIHCKSKYIVFSIYCKKKKEDDHRWCHLPLQALE